MKVQPSLVIQNPQRTQTNLLRGNKKTLSNHLRNKLLKSRFTSNTIPVLTNIQQYEPIYESIYHQVTHKLHNSITNTTKTNFYYENAKLKNKNNKIRHQQKLNPLERANKLDLVVQNSKPINQTNKVMNQKIQFHSQNLKQKMNQYLNFVINQSLKKEQQLLAQFQSSLINLNNSKTQRSKLSARNIFYRKMKSSNSKKQKSNLHKNQQNINSQIIQRAKQIKSQYSNRNKITKITNLDLSLKIDKYLKTTPNITMLE